MIIPLTLEEEWASRLDRLPTWSPPRRPTLVVAPHPDDETLAAGGLIVRLRSLDVPVTILAVTDGEHAYRSNRGLGKTREREQAEALAVLGVAASSVVRLRMTDSGVASREEMLLETLSAYVTCETHVIAPWPRDFHPDHEACGRAAKAAAARSGAALSFYLFWTWHRGTPELLAECELVSLPLTPDEQQRKLAALDRHQSQLNPCEDEPAILPPDLLAPARRSYEVFLPV